MKLKFGDRQSRLYEDIMEKIQNIDEQLKTIKRPDIILQLEKRKTDYLEQIKEIENEKNIL